MPLPLPVTSHGKNGGWRRKPVPAFPFRRRWPVGRAGLPRPPVRWGTGRGAAGTAQSESLFTAYGPTRTAGVRGRHGAPRFPCPPPRPPSGTACELSCGLPRPRACGRAAQSPLVPTGLMQRSHVTYSAWTHGWTYITGDYFYRNSFAMTLFLTKQEVAESHATLNRRESHR